MKILKYFALINLVLESVVCYSQNRNFVTDKFVKPVFIDSSKCTRNFIDNKQIRQVFFKLKKASDYATYTYFFEISNKGTIIPIDNERNGLITPFFKAFSQYKWKSGYKKGNIRCKMIGYGNLYLDIIPQKNIINLSISVGDGDVSLKNSIDLVYNHTIKM